MAAFGCSLCFSHDLDELVASFPLHKYTKCTPPTWEGRDGDGMGRCGGDVLDDGVGACMKLVSGPAVGVWGKEGGSVRGRWELSIAHLTCEAAVKM